MYPAGDLPGNLVAFCGVLRREYGFRLGPGEINDAARALHHVDITDQQRIRDAWRAILSSSRETANAFDRAFDAFFFAAPLGHSQARQPSRTEQVPSSDEKLGPGRRLHDQRAQAVDEEGDETRAGASLEPATEAPPPAEGTAEWQRARYSALEVEGTELVVLRPPSAAWRESARALVRRLQLGLSRRWRSAQKGRRFDLRRTWRASLQTGGEALVARWLRRVHRSPRVVVLIDGSRSMSGTQGPAIQLAVALGGVTRRVEVFAFSTTLTSLTWQVRRAGSGRTVRVTLSRSTWGGGTSIGASLRAFLQLHGERHVTRETLVVIVSDGLDVGEPDVLRGAMREIRRRAAGVLWLNPLLDTPGYEPSARGMVAARPFITTFASVPDAAGLARLARTLRLRS
jgi:uncharacterized protein with von Willebrand factor type A (vWA) domain